MIDIIFISVVGLMLGLFLSWGFKTLPGERWQIIATIPFIKDSSGQWKGINLTYYGFFSATAYLFSIVLIFVLFGAIDIPAPMIFILVTSVLAVCVPASSLVARIVEKKRHTFSVAGAFFVGVIIVPPVIYIINSLLADSFSSEIPFIPALAAISVAYAFGEGLGRLGCISFGCCYGKSLADTSPLVQKLFSRWNFVFTGDTKKIAYASGLSGTKVLPIQGITAVLYVTTGLLGVFMFLKTFYIATFVLTMVVTQVWRLYSETLRADYRGSGKITAYQVMAIAATLYAMFVGIFLSDLSQPVVDLQDGLQTLWDPIMLLFLQFIWLAIFIYTGRSSVTESTVAFRVCRERI